MAHIRKLKVKNTFDIIGRGTVWVIDLTDNGISPYRNKWAKDGIKLSDGIDGYVMCEERFGEDIFEIRGIEAFALGEGAEHWQIGLLVKQLKSK